MFGWSWFANRNAKKLEKQTLSAEQLAALNEPATLGMAVRALEMFIAREERKELAICKSRRRSLLYWVLAIVMGCATTFFVVGGGMFFQEPVSVATDPIRSIPLAGGKGVAHVAYIPLYGAIDGYKYGPPGPDNTEWYVENALKLAEKQKNISAIILNITSYGGDAVESAHGHHIIKKFRERTKIPVIAFISNYAYSGGYYLSLGANEIVIDPDANLGSVGVIMSWFNTATIGKVFDVGDVKIATGPLKSCIGQWVELTPACRESFARTIDYAFKRFLGAMSDSRHIPLDVLVAESQSNTGRSNGGTFSAEEAVSRQMADYIEDEDKLFERVATDIAKKHPDFKSVEFVQYDMKLSALAELAGTVSHSIQSLTRFMDTLGNMADSHAKMRAE